MQASHCKAAMRGRKSKDMANDWLCQSQIFFQPYETPQVFHLPGYRLCWVLTQVARWPTTSHKRPASAPVCLDFKGHVAGDGTSPHGARGDEVCTCEGKQHWSRAGIWGGGRTCCCNALTLLAPLPASTQRKGFCSSSGEGDLGGWQKWGTLRLERREGERELVLFQSR